MSNVPPHSIEHEKSLLGIVLANPENGYDSELMARLPKDPFYDHRHSVINRAFRKNQIKGILNDKNNVIAMLSKMKSLDVAGGASYVSSLSSSYYSIGEFDNYLKDILELWKQREIPVIIHKHGIEAIKVPMATADLVIPNLVNQLESVITAGSISKIKSAKEVIENKKEKGPTRYLRCGSEGMQSAIGGYGAGDMIVLAARPSMGKTSMAISELILLAKRGVPVAIISIESLAYKIVNRMIAQEANVNVSKINKNTLTSEEKELVGKAEILINELPIYIIDEEINADEVDILFRQLVNKYKVQLVAIDYLQKMPDLRKDKTASVSYNSNKVKSAAKKYEIPVIALSQVGRSKTGVKGMRPDLPDLRNSGEIEQDADVVVFLHRPEYYGLTQDANGDSLKGIGEVIVKKNRDDKLGDVQMEFACETAQWKDIVLDNNDLELDFSSEDNDAPF